MDYWGEGREAKMKNISGKMVLILFHKYFENKDIDMFDIAEIKRQGFDVEIWILVKLSYSFNIGKPRNCYEGKEVTEFVTLNQIEKRISKMNMRKSFFITYPGEAYDDISNAVRRNIVIHKGKYANYYYPLHLSVTPNLAKRSDNFFDVVKEYSYSWRNNQYKMYCDIKLLWNTFRYPSSYEFIQGEAGYGHIRNKFIGLSKKCIKLHSIDMDTYIRNKGKQRNNDIPKETFAVFVDQYMEGHSDFKKDGIKSPICSRERYYTELNNFFSMIEKIYDCKIVIALHPKAEYRDNPFQGRQMISNQTHALIENAAFCILHDSTCFSFILYNKKPFYQIITTDMRQDELTNKCIMEYEKQGFSKVCDISLLEEEKIKDYLNVYNADIHELYVDYFMGAKNNSSLLNMSVICKLIKKEWEKR